LHLAREREDDRDAAGDGAVSGNGAPVAILVGAALLAGWVCVRFPRRSPASLLGAGMHLLASVFALQVGMGVLGAATPEPMTVLAALFGAALPATVYMLVSAFWVLKLLHGRLDAGYRSHR
jgi:hypothetical protein